MSELRQKLGDLKKGMKALICKVGGEEYSSDMIRRLLEMGFLENSSVEVIHESPFGGDPIAVRIRGTVIALRRYEANAIEVSLI